MTDSPVAVPLLTNVLVHAIHAQNEADGERPMAFPTLFRHSDAGKCARALAYDQLGYAKEPVDLAGEHVMAIGNMIHERWQEALCKAFPGAEIEVPVRHGQLSSGHCDAVVRTDDGKIIVVELKTKGGFGFDRATGLDRKRYRQGLPEGPGGAAKIQGALNALAAGADLLVIGVIALEAVSRQMAGRLDLSEEARFLAEWHYGPDEFKPWAYEELRRLERLTDTVRSNYVSDRLAVGDDMEIILLDPETDRPDWRCTYCAHRVRCTAMGPGTIDMQGYDEIPEGDHVE